MQEYIDEGILADYLFFLGNLLIINKSKECIEHLLQRGIVVGLLRPFRNQQLLEHMPDTARWFLTILFRAFLQHNISKNPHLSELLRTFGDLLLIIIN